MTRPEISLPRGANAEIERLKGQLAQYRTALREVDHRTSNSLQIAASLMKMQQRTIADPEARAALDVASARLEAIARSHRHFHLNPTAGDVDIVPELNDLAATLSVGTGLTCLTEAAGPVLVPSRMSTPLMVVVNELVTNARKHAFGGRDGGTVRIRLLTPAKGRLEMTVTDDGVGLPDGFSVSAMSGMGMKVVYATVRQLGGTLDAETDGGAVFTVSVPLG